MPIEQHTLADATKPAAPAPSSDTIDLAARVARSRCEAKPPVVVPAPVRAFPTRPENRSDWMVLHLQGAPPLASIGDVLLTFGSPLSFVPDEEWAAVKQALDADEERRALRVRGNRALVRSVVVVPREIQWDLRATLTLLRESGGKAMGRYCTDREFINALDPRCLEGFARQAASARSGPFAPPMLDQVVLDRIRDVSSAEAKAWWGEAVPLGYRRPAAHGPDAPREGVRRLSNRPERASDRAYMHLGYSAGDSYSVMLGETRLELPWPLFFVSADEAGVVDRALDEALNRRTRMAFGSSEQERHRDSMRMVVAVPPEIRWNLPALFGLYLASNRKRRAGGVLLHEHDFVDALDPRCRWRFAQSRGGSLETEHERNISAALSTTGAEAADAKAFWAEHDASRRANAFTTEEESAPAAE